ncbi:MAG: hypothetical protein HYZ34_13930 [Ignavibacteriae bacterium]|nr:hypothetical protein [Ignavibacteriota bacterium]
MRLFLFGILCATLLSCREYHSFNAPVPISGYQINGKVTSKNGVALDDVTVRVYYNYTKTRTTLMDTINFIITDTAKVLQVSVFDAQGRYLKNLFTGIPSPGPLPRFFFDAIGDTIPSGKYFIKYQYDAIVVKTLPVLIEGKITATSDYKGEFIIEYDALPVGEEFDMYDESRHYAGTFRVDKNIDLFLKKGTKSSTYSIVVQKDFITKRTFTIE